jgi:hypothetical protein
MGMLLQTAIDLAIVGCQRTADDCGGCFDLDLVDKTALLEALRQWRAGGSQP